MWIVPSLYPESVRAGAGLVMNALDLAKFDAALSAKGLLNAHTLETMWEPVELSSGRIGDYAAGWRRWTEKGHVIVGTPVAFSSGLVMSQSRRHFLNTARKSCRRSSMMVGRPKNQ
jgi:hypothetical protein